MNATELTQALAFVLLVIFLAYVLFIVVPFVRRTPDPEGDADSFQWHVFIPCCDEEAVIGTTMTQLRALFPRIHIWVVDDASNDGTAGVVTAHMSKDHMIHLVRRRLPDARTGKGDALNSAYAALDEWLPDDTPRDQVIVVVVDADGRLAENALRQAAGPAAFGDSNTGAAQAAVWMSNRNSHRPVPRPEAGRVAQWWGRYLVRMQDIEFRTTIAAMQSLRGRTLSVGLGGNGQFTRLSVLDAIATTAGNPWHGALLEDYELGIHVMLAGYHNAYMHDTYVEQEGLPTMRRLLTQRTRWCQGGMQCARYLPRIFTSEYITNAGAIEVSYFLLMPFLQLAGVILWPTVLVTMVAMGSLSAGGLVAWLAASWWILPLVALTGILPFAIWPLLYRRHAATSASWRMGVAWGIGYWLYVYQSYVCVLRAFGRLLVGKNSWAKTRRNAEADRLLLARET